jgi:hypothetical protein
MANSPLSTSLEKENCDYDIIWRLEETAAKTAVSMMHKG